MNSAKLKVVHIWQKSKPRLGLVLLQSTQEAVEHERSVGENTRRRTSA